MKIRKQSDRQVLDEWEVFRKNIISSTPVPRGETTAKRKDRVLLLEKNHEEWFKFYFPKYFRYPSPDFHIKCSKAFLDDPDAYDAWNWARGLAKTTRARMCWTKLLLTKNCNMMIAVSDSETSAINKLTKALKVHLESNPRIINDYGSQKTIGSWDEKEFTSNTGFKVASIGAGQTPRGANNDEYRPQGIWIDDIDTDEECRNSERIKEKVKWVESALYPTMDISEVKRRLACGNIIAPFCTIDELAKKAKRRSIINIKDDAGNSTWPEKNTNEKIDEFLTSIDYSSQQKEYYNNPIVIGSIFDKMHYKILPPVKHYPFLVCYIDLSYKDGKKNDYKAATLQGRWKDEYHIQKAFLKQGTTRQLAEGLIEIEKFVNGAVPMFWVAEENFLQDIIRKELQASIKQLNSSIIITPDVRDKGDKITRIEAALEPLNRNGKLFLNQKEKDNPHMKLLDQQFTALDYGNRRTHDDGPDSVEGGKYIIDQKIITQAGGMQLGRRPGHKHRL